MAKPRSRPQSKRKPKTKTAAKALRSTERAEEILKQKTAYKRQKTNHHPETHASSGGNGVPPATGRVQHPFEVAAQNWMQVLMLPWAGWNALGAMMVNWPLRQAQSGLVQSRDDKPRSTGKAQARS